MLPPIQMPSVRHRTKSDRAKNGGFLSILSPTAKAIEVLSVEKIEFHVHNTKAVVVVEENGVQEERVLIYSRVDLAPVLANYGGPERNLQSVLEEMNLDGYDVTEDDIEYDEPNVLVKPTSLGYYEGEAEVSDCAVRRYFKVTLYGSDKNAAWYDVRDAMAASFSNLSVPPASNNLQFVSGNTHVYNGGNYQYTVVSVGILDYANGGGDVDQSARFTLPRLPDISADWQEILPNGDVSIPGNYDLIHTFAEDENHTIVRCIITEYSLS